ncbi:MAG: metalloregulator ArsR/SmtB family transcription factor [Chloroflexi bacterium]|jgi:DNA-binding transcriptional ArsR family regulator|nr:metalloregulator ArsR/SmtB family transcription factor [Chloroflexota bacterium]
MTGGTAAAVAPEIVLEARPAADFLISLMLDTEPELLPADRAWLEEARSSLSTGLRRDHARLFGSSPKGKGIGGAVIVLAMPDPAVRSAADVLALARRLDARDLVGTFREDDELRATHVLALRVLDGEDELRDEAIAACPEVHREAVGRLLADPAGELRALRRVLRAWAERFATIEARIGAMEQRDVDMRRGDLDRLPLGEIVERATGGVRWVPDGTIRRLYLIPSYFTRPYNYVFGGRDWHMFAYPLSERALGDEADAVPAASIRLFRALGDESRLRILRLLASGDLYLTEIAERMGLSKPTVSHHLAQLRAAGLVTITEAGALTYYSLRRDRVLDAGIELARYLGEPAG